MVSADRECETVACFMHRFNDRRIEVSAGIGKEISFYTEFLLQDGSRIVNFLLYTLGTFICQEGVRL